MLLRDRPSHHVFLEPETLHTEEIYCNGISTSLPVDVQELLVRSMPGCEHAEILRWGYAVEYDMVRPHQIDATCMTKSIRGFFLAGQINGTSGYEEAGGQGVVAGLNAARFAGGDDLIRLGREQSLGVMLDDRHEDAASKLECSPVGPSIVLLRLTTCGCNDAAAHSLGLVCAIAGRGGSGAGELNELHASIESMKVAGYETLRKRSCSRTPRRVKSPLTSRPMMSCWLNA